jgi:hypothetical protein
MKSLKFILLPFLLLAAALSYGQEPGESDSTEEEAQEIVFEDESFSYRTLDMFRILPQPRGQVGLFAISTPFMTQQSFGGGLDAQAWYTNNLAVGLSLGITGRKITPTFGYYIGQSVLTYYDLSLFNEFKLTNWHGFEPAFRLYTGFSVFHLADNTLKETYTWYDEYGFAYEGERNVTIARNTFMRVAPAFVLRYALGRYVALEATAAYNFFAGGPNFGTNSDFNNYQLQLGVKFNTD